MPSSRCRSHWFAKTSRLDVVRMASPDSRAQRPRPRCSAKVSDASPERSGGPDELERATATTGRGRALQRTEQEDAGPGRVQRSVHRPYRRPLGHRRGCRRHGFPRDHVRPGSGHDWRSGASHARRRRLPRRDQRDRRQAAFIECRGGGQVADLHDPSVGPAKLDHRAAQARGTTPARPVLPTARSRTAQLTR